MESSKNTIPNYIKTLGIKKVAIVFGILCVGTLLIISAYAAVNTKKKTAQVVEQLVQVEPSITSSPTKEIEIIPTDMPVPTNTPTPFVAPTEIPAVINTPTATPLNTPLPTEPPPDTNPPYISNLGGPANNSTVTFTSFCFPMMISDNYSHLPDLWTQYQFDNTSWNEWSNGNDAYSPCFQNVAVGQHTFSVRAKDAAGNISEATTHSFTVQP